MSKMPDKVREAFDNFPQTLRNDFLDLRNLIFEVAEETPGVGPLEETLKWGQSACLTRKTKAGSTQFGQEPARQHLRQPISFSFAIPGSSRT